METVKNHNAEPTENSNNPWGEEYQKSVPPFNPEGQPQINDETIVQRILEDDENRQYDLETWLKGLKNGSGLTSEAWAEQAKYDSEEEWAEAMDQELERIEQQQRILIDAHQAQINNPKFKGKTLEEVLKIQSGELSDYINKVAETISEEKFQELNTRRINMDTVAGRIETKRKYPE